MDDDIVLDILQRVVAAATRAGGFDEAMAIEIERQVRRDRGGERALITKTSPRERERRAASVHIAATEVFDGASPTAAAQRHGVSRATLYRLIGKK